MFLTSNKQLRKKFSKMSPVFQYTQKRRFVPSLFLLGTTISIYGVNKVLNETKKCNPKHELVAATGLVFTFLGLAY